ncbi:MULTISPECIES: hypothetical protein [Methylococcus]|uniref:PBP domain-containing protein n=1 Tax=Methylococcus capsulatus TaxID=414 RepID=A0ABZ2F4I2_METCP|nr:MULTISPECIES: hypothetical protein [Methylococcus]MDF9392098.1 hypothetical protein [Methylococcus capsulatus]
MKLRVIDAALLSGSLCIFSGPVPALQPAESPDITIRIAGSTIQDNNFKKVLDKLCKPATLDVYKDADATGKGTYWKAFFCQIDSSQVPGLNFKDPKVLLLKRNRSGAITGIYPLLEPEKTINFMGINNSPRGEAQCTPSGSQSWTCRTDRPGDVFKALPDMGVSDIDPQIFRDINFNAKIDDTSFNPPTPAAVAATLTVKNAGAVLQNTPVSKNLRDALQEAQVAQGKLDAQCLTDATLRETESCMPSLSKGFLTSLFAGHIGKWSDVKVEFTASGSSGPTSRPLTDFNSGSFSTPLVHICRRNKGASTQAAINAYFLNNPCAATGSVPVEVSNPVSGPVVIAPTQVTMEEYCLADFNDGTNNGTYNPNSVKAWAVGMLTTERNGDLALGYRYIKIDGAAPTVEEVAAGHYQYFSEAAYVWRRNAPAPTGDTLTLIQKLATDATTPSMFGQLNTAITQPWGKGSFIAVSAQGYPVTHPFDPNSPVTAYTHAPAGSLDNCIYPQVAEGQTPNL